MKAKIKGLFRTFPREFWIVNTFELFERAAYYGMMGIFAYHFIYNIHIDDALVGVALGILAPLLYFMPLISATIAEKYGYKPVFIVSFVGIMLGYFTMYMSSSFSLLLLSVFILGIGAGAFKPMVSATIAHVTPSEHRNFGYSIYYWTINLGAFLAPLLIGYYVEFVLNDTAFYRLSFLFSVLMIGINLFLCIFMFSDPVEAQRDLPITRAFVNLAKVMVDKRFVALLLIYAGFWFMYSLNHSFLAVYLVDYGIKPEWFPIAWIGIINPGTIIIAGPFISKWVDGLSKRFNSLQLMVMGMAVFMAGMLMVAFVPQFLAVLLGIILFSVGEFLVHPNFLTYVSRLAPKDRVAMYMGYAFIPTGIGYTLGSLTSGLLYANLSVQMHRPALFWSIIMSVGLLTISLLLFYNARLAHHTVSGSNAHGGVKSGIWERKSAPITVLLIVPVLILAGFSVGEADFKRFDNETDHFRAWNGWDGYTVATETTDYQGTCNEQSTSQLEVPIEHKNVLAVRFVLTWEDEEDIRYLVRTYENQPDTFSLSIATPDGRLIESDPVENQHGEAGRIDLVVEYSPAMDPDISAIGTYNVSVTCENAGDYRTTVGLIGFVDEGNDWELAVSVDYYAVGE